MGYVVQGDYSFVRNSLFKHLQEKMTGLLFVTGGSDSCRSSLLKDISAATNTEVLNLSFLLSKEMKILSKGERPLRASGFLSELLSNRKSVIFDHIELLFDPQLKLRAINTLRLLARGRSILTIWPGNVKGEFVTYAQRGHPEFMEARLDNEVVFKIE